MIQNAPATPPTTDALVKTALEKVRAICKGNGIKMDSVRVLSHAIEPHALNAGTYLELKPATTERHMPGKVVAGQLAGTREEAVRLIDQSMAAAVRDPSLKARIADTLLRRPDKGFGLARQAVPIDFLKREYTYHESCSTCRGNGQGMCARCGGRRTESCAKCSGRGLMPCPLCRATGLVQGAKCTRCVGQRYIRCDLCHGSAQMGCRTCGATGVMKCAACGGVGWKSHILTTGVQAIPYFEYEAKSIPQGAADMIETGASLLAEQQKVNIQGRIADDKDNVLGASYEVQFPYGDIVFALGKKEVKAKLFGYKADLVAFPFILDKILAAAVEELEEAAQDIGSVAEKIRKASRYRLIAQAFVNAGRLGTQKTAALLLKTYEIGLSHAMAEKIAALADRTTARITHKPRLHGLAIGLCAAAALNALYYLTPVRGMLASYLPTPKMDVVLDIFLPVLGGIVTALAIQLSAGNAIKKALGHLFPAGRNGQAMPRAGIPGRWGFAASALLTLIMMEAAPLAGQAAPYWYEMIRTFLARTFVS